MNENIKKRRNKDWKKNYPLAFLFKKWQKEEKIKTFLCGGFSAVQGAYWHVKWIFSMSAIQLIPWIKKSDKNKTKRELNGDIGLYL